MAGVAAKVAGFSASPSATPDVTAVNSAVSLSMASNRWATSAGRASPSFCPSASSLSRPGAAGAACSAWMARLPSASVFSRASVPAVSGRCLPVASKWCSSRYSRSATDSPLSLTASATSTKANVWLKGWSSASVAGGAALSGANGSSPDSRFRAIRSRTGRFSPLASRP